MQKQPPKKNSRGQYKFDYLNSLLARFDHSDDWPQQLRETMQIITIETRPRPAMKYRPE